MTRFTRFVRIIPVAAAFLAATQSVQAQSPVAGKWLAEFELGMRNDNGVVSSMGTGKARITLEAKGDSVFGSWVTLEPQTGPAAQTRPLKGVFANGRLVLESEPRDQRINLNGEAQTVSMKTRWELTLEGDALSGTTRQIALSNSDLEPPSRPFKAVKEKS